MAKSAALKAWLMCGAVFASGPALAQNNTSANATPQQGSASSQAGAQVGTADPSSAASLPTVTNGSDAQTAQAGQAGLQDIIVTAQRREESSQRAPIAIDVIQPAALAQVTDPQSLTKLAPAVQIGTAGGAAPLLYIRGVGTFSSNPYTDSAVAINYDGIYLGRPTSAFGLFYDLDRVEVLKGPQGTLYGRNATGGALNIIPTQPKLNLTEVTGTLSYGNYNAVNAQAAVNIPISDKAALRVAGLEYRHDAYNDDGTYRENGAGGRAQLLLKPQDGLSIRISGDFFHLGGTGNTATILATSGPTGAAIPTNFSPNAGLYDAQSTAVFNSTFIGLSGSTYGPLPQRPYIDNKFYGVNTEINGDLGFAQLTFVGAWRRSDLNNVTAPETFVIKTLEKDEQYSLEARLAGKVGPVDWLVGGYFFNEEVDAAYLINDNFLGVDQTFKAENDSYAAFGRLTYHLTDTLRLTGAVRYTKDDKSFNGVASSVTGICALPTHSCPLIRRLPADISNLPAALASIGYIQPPGVPVYVDVAQPSGSIYSPSQTPVNGQTSPDKVTYRAAAEYEPRAGSLLYASVETGYRSGGFSFSTIRPVYDPETITAYTIGSKNRFLDNRLQINVEAFYWKYKNQQVSHQSIGRTGGIEFVTENIGSSTNKGIEGDITAKPLRNTLLHADVQYLDAHNDSFVFNDLDTSGLAGLPAGTVPPTENCPYTVVPGAGTYRIDCSGKRALRSPEWTMNFGAQQIFDLSNGLQLSLEGNTHYQSSNILMFERRAFSVQSSYWLTDAAITLSGAGKRWSVAGFVNNIGDKRILSNSYFNSFSGLTSGNYNPPRTYGARVSFRY